MSSFKLKIVCPEGSYYDGEVDILNIRTSVGQMGILAHMLPFVCTLEIGEMNFIEKGVRKHFFVSSGFVHVQKDEVVMITDAIESQDQIDLERAKKAKQRAERRLASKRSDLDIMRAELALKRAIERIRIKNM